MSKPIITNWIENVPVRGLAGEIIGRARVSNKGEIHASIDVSEMAQETYDKLVLLPNLYGGLTIVPQATSALSVHWKYSEEVKSRLAAQIPLDQEGAH